MEKPEQKSSPKVWPRDFVRLINGPDKKEQIEEINSESDKNEKNLQVAINNDNYDTITIYPTRIEAKIINFNQILHQ